MTQGGDNTKNTAEMTIVICLLWVLLVFYVSAQPVCDPGWLGPGCKYRCRCQTDNCKESGQCIGSFPCTIGWFGPACQFADLAYNVSDKWEVTDANDETCLATGNVKRVVLTFSGYYRFTWLRAVASEANVLHKLFTTFERNGSYVSIVNTKMYDVDEMTVDIYGELAASFNQIILFGDAVNYLCSVYVSGGRNLALKENAVQSSTYNERSGYTNQYNIFFTANLAVDGSRENNFYTSPYCASTTNIVGSSWEVHLCKPRLITRYRLYSRDDYNERMQGFLLNSYDGRNQTVFNYTDSLSTPHSVYEVSHSPLTVQRLKVRPGANGKMLTLCEVEIYGDTICEPGTYGFECEHKCNCRVDEACTVTDGFCPSGCATGYRWKGCSVECGQDTFGLDCTQTCSTECVQPNIPDTTSCDHVNGTCLYGCHSAGYTGITCTEKCDNGYFGVGCQDMCSHECKPPSHDNGYLCDHVNGTCLNGCNRGFFGSLCTEKCPKGTYGEDCKQLCSEKCAQPLNSAKSPCYHIDGMCRSGCNDGFTGTFCSEAPLLGGQYTAIILGLCVTGALIFCNIFCLFRRREAIRTSPPEDILPSPASTKSAKKTRMRDKSQKLEGILKHNKDDDHSSEKSSNPQSVKVSSKRRTKSKSFAVKRHQSVSV